MRVVIDTSVLFAAFISRAGLCARVVEHVASRETMICSQYILHELHRHLLGKAKLSEAATREIVESLRSASALVEPTDVPATDCRDPKDAPILGTVVASGAQLLISGDKDLLVLGRYGGAEIVSPRQFVDRYALDA
jgi:uncharacterized protein